MRAAELIATKYRYDLLATTMVGQVHQTVSISLLQFLILNINVSLVFYDMNDQNFPKCL